ncbi:PLP-dependent aminotransferase family protein [Gordonia desulfuricans]|uniref:PLP-dependent aminotransferase family protein n=1 Tax=Gordonia desulfuricans TaxID=89051 RepID=A0A7K3LK03_9ACTN|nr:PLP-dependent aminotransferase family protein [Gordonia desulfuricans]NDK88401.1 PLP-dependent aminotransferase family protein [Gordonia desulfuricans]
MSSLALSSDYVPSHALANVRGSAIRDLLKLTEQPHVLSLAGGLPATELIPAERISECAARISADSASLQYTVSAGVHECREAVASYDDVTTPRRVLLTHGSQQALFLLAHALVNPGEMVVVDDPVYVGALQVFQSVRAEVVALPITSAGTDVDALRELLETGARPRIVHTVSNFHNPAGVTATTQTRIELARLADHYGFVVVEDDPYGRLRFTGDDVATIAAHGERVVRLGSASKILAPALRVGWMSGPPEIIAMVELLRQGADLCGSTFSQLIVAELLDDRTWLDNHIARVRDAYRLRAAALATALSREFGDRVEFTRPEGGMFCWARVPGADTSALLAGAVDAGVAYVPGAAFGVRADFGDCLRLSYSALTPDELSEAVRRLSVALLA